MFLIDTSTCVSLLRGTLPRAAARLKSAGAGGLAISSICAAELYFGAAKSRSPAIELRRIQSLLNVLEVLPFELECAASYGILRSVLESKGEVIGQMDMLIAAHALTASATLVTHNVREFSRVPGLSVEDWAA